MTAEGTARYQHQLEMLVNRTHKNLRKLKSWRTREGVTCYRLYDRDIPEIPLAVDWYDGRLHVAVYARGSALPRQAQAEWLVSGLAKQLDVPPDRVFIKVRKKQTGGHQYRQSSYWYLRYRTGSVRQ